MIGGGGSRIGRPPAGMPEAGPTDGAAQKPAAGETPKGPKPSDSFEKAAAKNLLPSAPKPALGREGTPSDFVKLARDNPQAAARIADGLAAQAKNCLGDIEKELAG